MDDSGTRQPPSTTARDPRADMRVTGKIRDLILSILYNGFPVVARFLSTARVSTLFAKTDVGLRQALEVTSNEAANEAGLFVDLTGGAVQANRIVDLIMAETGVAFGGKLRLNHFGGDVESGILGTTTLATVAAGATTLTQPATGTTTAKIVTIVGSTVNGFEVDASAITNGLKWIWDKFHHMTATQAAVPVQTLDVGAGTGPTNTGCIAGSNDHYGKVQWTQGAGAPAAGSRIMSVAFKNAYATVPASIILTSGSGNTNNGLLVASNITTTGFDILNGATQATVATGIAGVYYRVN